MPPRPSREGGGVFMKWHFALMTTLVLIGFLAVPGFSPLAAAGPASVQAWKRELRGAPMLEDTTGQGGQDSGISVGTNVRVNAVQDPAGRLGRSETTIATAHA